MSVPNNLKVKVNSYRIAFLLAHQQIDEHLKEIAEEIHPGFETIVNRESPEYLLGAHEALMHLLHALEEKGPAHKL